MTGINIVIPRELHKKLCDLGNKGDTFAEIILRLVEK